MVGKECKEVAQRMLLEAVKQRDYERCVCVCGGWLRDERLETVLTIVLTHTQCTPSCREQARLREEAAQSLTSDLLVETTTAEVEAIAQESLR